MNKEVFYRYLKHPELLDDRSVGIFESILEEYPYFQSARLLHIKNLSNQGSIKYDKELRKTAVWVTDRSKLYYLLDKRVLLPVNEPSPLAKPTNTEIENSETNIDFSELTLVTDFSGLGAAPEMVAEQENDELDQLIMSGSVQSSTFFDVSDYINLDEFKNAFKKNKSLSASEKKAETATDRKNKLIDAFIVEQPRIIPNAQETASSSTPTHVEKPEPPELITDTLAKIYIKQGFYDKAIFAYEKLSLKYPEKNSYFADQIRKIKQIINNQ